MAVDSQENQSGLFGGLLGLGGNRNIAAPPSNPYLSINSSYINDADEFIPLSGEDQNRGAFQQSVSKIGATISVGCSFGAAQGLYRGLLATQNSSGVIKRTQILNHVSKNMSSHASTLGTLAVMYHGSAVLLGKARGQEDSLNGVVAGTLTGFLYQCPGGLRRGGIGGAVGLVASGLWALWSSNVDESNFNSTKYYS